MKLFSYNSLSFNVNPLAFIFAFLAVALAPKKYYLFNSKSSTLTTNLYDNRVDNVGFQEVEGAATFVKGSNNTIVDGGAISGAFGAVESLIQATTTQGAQNQAILNSAITGNATATQEAMKGDTKTMAELAKVGLALFATVAVVKAWKGKK